MKTVYLTESRASLIVSALNEAIEREAAKAAPNMQLVGELVVASRTVALAETEKVSAGTPA